jgi:hypothetical protein
MEEVADHSLDFDSISLEGVGRRDAPFPHPVSANSYDKQFNTPLTYNFNLTFEREVITGVMARAAYVGSRNRNGRFDAGDMFYGVRLEAMTPYRWVRN